MAQDLFWFYDICAAGIILVTAYCGSKRGLMRSVVLIAMMAVSVVCSWLLSTVGAPVIYEKALRSPIMTALTDASEKTNPLNVVSSAVSDGGYGVEMTNPEIEGVIAGSAGSDFFTNIASEIKNNGSGKSQSDIEAGVESSVTEGMLKALVGDVVSPDTLKEILTQVTDAENNLKNTVNVFLKGDRNSTAETVEELLIAPAVKLLLKAIIWVAAMAILTVISGAIANAFKSLNKIPIIGPVNVLAGAIFGAAEGILIIYVAAQIVKLICIFTTDSLIFLNSSTVARTYVFRYFYDFDIAAFLSSR